MATTAGGTAILRKNYETGEVTVEHADPVIRVSTELLNEAEAWAWDGEVLTLDTAGTHRYRRIDNGDDAQVWLFERIYREG